MRRRQTLMREIEQRQDDGRYVIHRSARGWSDAVLPCCGNPAADVPPWDRMARVREFDFAATCPRLVGAPEQTNAGADTVTYDGFGAPIVRDGGGTDG